MTAFWVLAPLMVIAALGLLFARKAVHAALCLAVVMIALAMLYAIQDAPFLFAVQIIVYTGAIMMLFLFVLMLVGTAADESLKEVIQGQRLAAVVVGVLFLGVVVVAIGQTIGGTAAGLGAANSQGNVEGLAKLMFDDYVVGFQFTAALLITAVLAAMVLAHRQELKVKLSQGDTGRARMREYAEGSRHPGNAPTPGVFARHNAVDAPAPLPDGSPARDSVASSINERDQVRTGFDDDIDDFTADLEPETADAWPEESSPPERELSEAPSNDRPIDKPEESGPGESGPGESGTSDSGTSESGTSGSGSSGSGSGDSA